MATSEFSKLLRELRRELREYSQDMDSQLAGRYTVDGATTVALAPSKHSDGRIEGWKLHEIEIHPVDSEYEIPDKYQEDYFKFFEDETKLENPLWDADGSRDGQKAMLAFVPDWFSDTDKWPYKLYTASSKFSHSIFSRDKLIIHRCYVEACTSQVLELGANRIHFPHILCLHLLLVSSDDKIAVMLRGPNLAFHPGSQSCTLEETIKPAEDFTHKPGKILVEWFRRALREEANLFEEEGHYSLEQARLLSVIYEWDQVSFSLCGLVHLNMPGQAFFEHMDRPKEDWEVFPYDLFSWQECVSELRNPTLNYSATSRYRLFMGVLAVKGVAWLEEELARQKSMKSSRPARDRATGSGGDGKALSRKSRVRGRRSVVPSLLVSRLVNGRVMWQRDLKPDTIRKYRQAKEYELWVDEGENTIEILENGEYEPIGAIHRYRTPEFALLKVVLANVGQTLSRRAINRQMDVNIEDDSVPQYKTSLSKALGPGLVERIVQAKGRKQYHFPKRGWSFFLIHEKAPEE